MLLRQHQHVRSDCESGRPVGRSGRGHPGVRLLVFHFEQKLRYLGASVMLFSWSGRGRNALQYRERLRKQQLCKQGFLLVCSRRAVSVGRSAERRNRRSLCYLTLWSSDVSLQTADPDLIGKNPSAVVWDLVDCLDNLQIVHVVHVAAVSCLISGNNGWSYPLTQLDLIIVVGSKERGTVCTAFWFYENDLCFYMDQGESKCPKNLKSHKAFEGIFFLPLFGRITVTTIVHIFPLIISMRLAGIEKIAVIIGTQTYAVPPC